MHSGWYQIAYSRDLTKTLTEVSVGGTKIALLRRDDGTLTAISAHCPHRGANLCRGGQLKGDRIICPFHGFPVNLGPEGRFQAKHFNVLEINGLIFIKENNDLPDNLPSKLKTLAKDHFIVPGFEVALIASAEMVIENAFDQSHFRPVHKVSNEPKFANADTEPGCFAVSSVFELPASRWQRDVKPGDTAMAPFLATAYSPTVVLTHLGGARPYYMLTATHPISAKEVIARLSLILPPQNGHAPSEEDCVYLLQQAKGGLMQDSGIWESLAEPEIFDPVESDEFVIGFRAFCDRFKGTEAAK